MEKQEFFYTAEQIEKRVSKDEFEQYLANYPRKLERDVCGIGDPPQWVKDFLMITKASM